MESSWLADNCQILAVRSDNCQIGHLSDRTTVSGDNCQWRQLSVGTAVSGPTVSGNCKCFPGTETTVRSYSFRADNCKILQFQGGQSLQFFPIGRRWQKVELNENDDELLINSNCTQCLSLSPFHKPLPLGPDPIGEKNRPRRRRAADK